MKYHHDAVIATESFLNSVENLEQNVNNRKMTKSGIILSEIGTSLNVFQKPSFSVVDSELPCVKIMKTVAKIQAIS